MRWYSIEKKKGMQTFLRSLVLATAIVASTSSLIGGAIGESGPSLKQLAKETKALEAAPGMKVNHRQLAANYRQLAQLQFNESNKYAQQAAWLAQFPIYTSTKYKISTIDNYRYFASKYQQDAQKSEQMAVHHERLAS